MKDGTPLNYILIFTGMILALILACAFLYLWAKKQAEGSKARELELIINRLKESFGALSFEALSKNTTEFLKIARETLIKHTEDGEKDLETKKVLIDQTLESIKGEMKNLRDTVSNFEKDREQKYGELSNQLKFTAAETGKLHETAAQLKNALANTSVRGQWGPRMADDVLRLAGFIEGINYIKEKAQATVNTRPDYTFFLPQGLKVNMDVKFPLNNYWKYIETENAVEKERYTDLFLKDARMRIKEATNRDYINPEEKTVDYVIVFIPNEQVYSFIHEHDRTLLDDALRNKVILCSPLTLYAILAVIRHAVDNFTLERTAAHMLSLLGSFNKQWDAFVKSFDRLGKKIQETQDEYNSLTSTRRNQLDRQMRRIEDLRKQKGIPDTPIPEDEEILSLDKDDKSV